MYFDRRKFDAKVIYGDGGGHRILSKIYTTINEKLGSIVIRRIVLSMRIIVCDGKMIDCLSTVRLVYRLIQTTDHQSLYSQLFVFRSVKDYNQKVIRTIRCRETDLYRFPTNMLSLIIRANL